eukprot:7393905-Pyramimonas_sp.AAC.1
MSETGSLGFTPRRCRLALGVFSMVAGVLVNDANIKRFPGSQILLNSSERWTCPGRSWATITSNLWLYTNADAL